jgi:uncharacterized protein
VKDEIIAELDAIERDHAVRVLYCCESGSRAWGFESVDSDYDPRFIYVHPQNWYLSIEQGRDVIERQAPGDLDLAGWELAKALRLFRKSNPPMMEWLASPLVYRSDDTFMFELRELLPVYYSPDRCFMHYRSMAVGNYRTYLKGEVVRLKKYLYVLRPVLGCLWIERGMGPVPVQFVEKLDALFPSGALREEIDELIRIKMSGGELDEGKRNDVISGFLERELERLEGLSLRGADLPDPEPLNDLFRRTIRRAEV